MPDPPPMLTFSIVTANAAAVESRPERYQRIVVGARNPKGGALILPELCEDASAGCAFREARPTGLAVWLGG